MSASGTSFLLTETQGSEGGILPVNDLWSATLSATAILSYQVPTTFKSAKLLRVTTLVDICVATDFVSGQNAANKAADPAAGPRHTILASMPQPYDLWVKPGSYIAYQVL